MYNNYLSLYEPVGAMGEVEGCETRETQDDIRDFDGPAYAAVVVFSAIAALMLLGTMVDVYQQIYRKVAAGRGGELETDPGAEHFASRLLKCFSVDVNGKKVLNTDISSANADYLDCVDGIRVLSMLWIILGHTYFVATSLYLRNPMKKFNLYYGHSTVGYEVILNSQMSVDSFFFLSGLLVAYFAFQQMEKKRFNIVIYYVHRFIR